MARTRKEGRVVASVALVVHRVDRTFAAMRSNARGGKVSLLGGGVERGEDPGDAAIREAREESGGIRVERVRLLGVWPSDDGVICSGYLAVKWSPSVLPELPGSEEGPAFWATRSEVLSPDSAFPGWTAKLLAAYDAWLALPPRR